MIAADYAIVACFLCQERYCGRVLVFDPGFVQVPHSLQLDQSILRFILSVFDFGPRTAFSLHPPGAEF